MKCQGPHCTMELEQKPGSHRQRIYCSDRCRIAASRWRKRDVRPDQEQRAARMHHATHEQVARAFGMLTEESVELLVALTQRDATLAHVVGQALARERDQALANHRRRERERMMQVANARKRGSELGYPEVPILDLGQGEFSWRTYLADPQHDLEVLLAELAQLAQSIKTIKVELYLRVENNSKFVRGKGRVRDEIERYILYHYAMEKHANEVEYTLTIPHESDDQLEQIIYRDILQEAARLADARHCFIEADVRALDGSDRQW